MFDWERLNFTTNSNVELSRQLNNSNKLDSTVPTKEAIQFLQIYFVIFQQIISKLNSKVFDFLFIIISPLIKISQEIHFKTVPSCPLTTFLKLLKNFQPISQKQDKQNLKAFSKKILSNHVYRFSFIHETLGFNIQVKTYRKPSQISIFPILSPLDVLLRVAFTFCISFRHFSMSLKTWGRKRKKERRKVERESETYFLCGKWHHFMYVLCLRHVFCWGGTRGVREWWTKAVARRKGAFKIALTDTKMMTI